jgi:uncharacterized protein YcbX
MSKFAVKGAATGTGTFTLESPATNTDRTFTLPDTDGSFITADGSGNVRRYSVTPQHLTTRQSVIKVFMQTLRAFKTPQSAQLRSGTTPQVLCLRRLVKVL